MSEIKKDESVVVDATSTEKAAKPDLKRKLIAKKLRV